ncbi:MAG: nitroreductase family protein [Candidatus Nealsonbacteria bacterium]
MELFKAIKTRYSVRAYKKDLVPEDKLNRVLEAVRLAPSAHNSQDWKFVLVKDEAKRKALAKAANNQEFVGEAPIVVVAVSLNPDAIMSCEVPRYAVDLGIALEHLALSAVSEGLGTCWIGAFSQTEVKKILNIPDNFKVAALMPLGFPADSPKAKNRKEIKEIVSYDAF